MAIYFELEDFHLSDYWDYFSTNCCCLQGGRVEDYQTRAYVQNLKGKTFHQTRAYFENLCSESKRQNDCSGVERQSPRLSK